MSKERAIEIAIFLRDKFNADSFVISNGFYYACLARDYLGSEINIAYTFTTN